jgi:transposase
MDESGRVTASFTICHDADGLRRLVRRLAGYGEPGSIPVGIERPSGRLVDVLLEAGHPVVPVKPNAIKAWRESEVLSGAKSDAADAAVIAEYVRLRHHRLRVVAPYSGQSRALRTVVRTREDLVEMRVAAANQLAALLETWWPGARSVFAGIESPIALEFLTRYPTPASPSRLGEGRMAAFCARQHYSGRRSPAELITRLQAAAPGTLDEALTPALRDAVLALVTVLKALNAAVKEVTRSVSGRLAEHPDGEIFTSLPRSGQVSAAAMLAERGDCRDAYDGPDSVAALAGMCRHEGVRQAPGRRLPLGMQQALPPGHDHLRRPQQARQPVGRPGLRRRHQPRLRPRARRAHPRPRLDPGDLPLLARRRPLRPRRTRRRCRSRHAAGRAAGGMRLTQGVCLRAAPRDSRLVQGSNLRRLRRAFYRGRPRHASFPGNSANIQPLLNHDYPPPTGNYRVQPELRLGPAVSGPVSRLRLVASGPTASSLRPMGGRRAHRAGQATRQGPVTP